MGTLNLYGLKLTFLGETVNTVVNSKKVYIVEGWFSFYSWEEIKLFFFFFSEWEGRKRGEFFTSSG